MIELVYIKKKFKYTEIIWSSNKIYDVSRMKNFEVTSKLDEWKLMKIFRSILRDKNWGCNTLKKLSCALFCLY